MDARQPDADDGRVLTDYLPPPPPGGAPPSRWGDRQALEALLADARGRLRATTQKQLQARFDGPQSAADFLIRTAGHVVSQEPELRAAGRWEALRNDLTAFVTERGERCADGLNLTFDYLVATAERA